MIVDFAYIALAPVLLFVGAEGLVKGNVSLVLRAGLSRLMVGFTIGSGGDMLPWLAHRIRDRSDALSSASVFTPLAPMPSVLGHTGSTDCWLFFCPELHVLLAGSVNETTAGSVPFRTVPRILVVLRNSKRVVREEQIF